jgi:hypothetical protein
MSQLEQLRNIIQGDVSSSLDNEYITTDDEYSDDDYESENEYSYEMTAQQHWEESMKQVEGLLSFIIFPILGKVLGRRFSHLVWKRVAEWWF